MSTPKHCKSQHDVLSGIPQNKQTHDKYGYGNGYGYMCNKSQHKWSFLSYFLVSLPHMEVSHKCHNLDISHHPWWWCQGQHIFQNYPIFFSFLLQMHMSHKHHNLGVSYLPFMSRAPEPPIIKLFFNRPLVYQSQLRNKDARRRIFCFYKI